MQPRELVEVAGLISLRSGPLLQAGATLSSDALSEYWIASRCRLDAWGRALRVLGHSQSTPPSDDAADLLLRLAEEVTLAEVLTRIIAGVCSASDQRQAHEDAGPIGMNALAAHRETASRLKAITFAWWPADSPRTRHTRALTKQADSWSDVLLAYVSVAADVDHLAIDPSRLREYAYDSQVHGNESSQAASQLLKYSLQTSFASATQPALNASHNRRVAGAAMALFGEQGFDGHGLMRPPWMLRAERTADDTETLVERLFDDLDTSSGIRLPQRWRI